MVGLVSAAILFRSWRLVMLCRRWCTTPFEWAPGSLVISTTRCGPVTGLTLRVMRRCSRVIVLLLVRTLSCRTMNVMTFRLATLLAVFIMVVLVISGREISVDLILAAETWRFDMPTMLLMWFSS